MKIDIFTLCDGVYCYEDKLFVIGSYDTIIRENLTAAPFEINIAAHITFDADECGDNAVNLYGEEISSGQRVLDLKNNLSIRKREQTGTGILNVALSGLPVIFPQTGKYKFTLEVEGKAKSEIILNVLSRQ